MSSAGNQESICVPVNNISHDVMTDNILPRLPAKSLSRFKCVSQVWLQSISDPKLAKTHLTFQTPGRINISPQGGAILHFTNSAESYKLNLFDILGENRLIPLKSCNGLLLVRQRPSDDGCEFKRTVKHYIINPVTRRHLNIPRAINPVKRSVASFKDCFMHYDNVSNEYKVLGWDANVNRNPNLIYVLVLGDRHLENDISWRFFRQPQDLIMMWYQPAVFSGWCHWIVMQHLINGEWAILAFNIEIGEFKVMKVPDTAGMIPSNGWNYRLVTAKESLYLVQHHCPGMNDYCYVLWKLEDYERQIWNEAGQYRVEYCQRCKESGWDNTSSSSTTLFDVREIIEGPRYCDDVAHTNSLVWLDTKL